MPICNHPVPDVPLPVGSHVLPLLQVMRSNLSRGGCVCLHLPIHLKLLPSAIHCPFAQACVTLSRGVGGTTSAICVQAATDFSNVYDTGVVLSSPWSCISFTATSINICATAASAEDATTLVNNFSNAVLFGTFYPQIGMACRITGPAASRYTDSATLTTCTATALQTVPCLQPKPAFPNW